MKRYEFMEKVHIYYTVYAESEDEAWSELDKISKPIEQNHTQDYSVDVIECFINYAEESENVE